MDWCGVIVVEDACDQLTGAGSVPPATEEVANRPIIGHVLEAVRAAEADPVFVVVSAAGVEAVSACLDPRHSRVLVAPRPVDFHEAIRVAAAEAGGQSLLVHSAAGMLGAPLTPVLEGLSEGFDAVITVHPSVGASDGRVGPGLPATLAPRARDGETSTAETPLGLAQIAGLGPGALERIEHEPGEERPGALGDLIEELVGAGALLRIRTADAWRSYRGEAGELLALNQLVLDGIDSIAPECSAGGNRIEGRVRIHRDAIVRDSVVVGPVVIGPGARIADAYIGPYTAVGARARVEGAEIERSIISPGASILHIGGRLTASLVGRDARIFRDFSLPRAVRLRIGAGTEVALC